MNYDLTKLGLSEEELFSRVEHDDSDSEKIAAPRYSYWQSVFRVFFKNKVNIFVLAVLAVLVLFAYIYPMLTTYDKFGALLDPTAKHLTPAQAIEKYGVVRGIKMGVNRISRCRPGGGFGYDPVP